MYKKICSKLTNNNLKRHCNFYRKIQESRRDKSCFISQPCYSDLEKCMPEVLDSVPTDDLTRKMKEAIKKITKKSSNDKRKPSGMFTLFVYETLMKPEHVTEKAARQINALAWSTELVNSYSKILDDIEIHGPRSHGKSCWHTYEASLCRSFINEVIKANFSDKLYVDFVDLFDKAFLNIANGLHLDFVSKTSKNYNNFNMEQYNRIVECKTTFHCFKLPMLLIMKLLNIDDKLSYKQVDDICLDLGRLYQVQTDFLDVYGEVYDDFGIPNHSRDIQEGKCCWPAIAALTRFTPAQRIVFTSCYGSKEPAHIERVNLLYDQIGLPKIYREEQSKISDTIADKCEKATSITPKLFMNALDAILKNKL